MLSPPAQLKVNKFPHHEGLSEADSSQDSYPNKKNIKVSCSQIKALIVSCGEAKADGENGQGQGEQPPKDKQDGPYGEAHLSVLVAEIDQTGDVEKKLNKVVQHEQDKTQTVQVQNVGAGNVDQVQEDVHKLTWNILFLCLLEVQFWKSMQPITHLTNVVELHLEWH